MVEIIAMRGKQGEHMKHAGADQHLRYEKRNVIGI